MLILSKIKKPSIEDYLAGTLLACSFVWVWSVFFSFIGLKVNAIFQVVSYAVYSMGTVVASYLVTGRDEAKRLTIGLKVGFGAWVASMLLVFPLSEEESLTVMIALLVCLLFGGVLGSLIRQAVKSVNRTPKNDK